MGDVTKEPFALGSLSLIVMMDPSQLPKRGELWQSRRTDKQGEGGRQFVEEQQPPWVPSAALLKRSQLQRKVARD